MMAEKASKQVGAKTIREEVERERREKQAANAVNQHTKLEPETSKEKPCNKKLLQPKPPRDPNTNAASHKAAQLFNTNRTYVNQASKIKEKAPDLFGGPK